MSNVTIKITETNFAYCNNGKKVIKKAAKLQEAGSSIDTLSNQERAFLAAIYTLYTQDYTCDLDVISEE